MSGEYRTKKRNSRGHENQAPIEYRNSTGYSATDEDNYGRNAGVSGKGYARSKGLDMLEDYVDHDLSSGGQRDTTPRRSVDLYHHNDDERQRFVENHDHLEW